MKIRILAAELESLVPDERMHTKMRDPVELDEMALSLVIDQGEGVDSESLHHTVGPRDCPVRHGPHEEVGGFGVHVHEIPEVIVGALRLGNFIVWFWLERVDCLLSVTHPTSRLIGCRTKVRELECFLNREDRYVVPDNIPISFVSIEFGGETPDITDCISTSPAPLNSGKAHKNRRVPRRICQNTSVREVLNILLELKVTKSTRTASVHNTLRDTLVVEAMNLKPS